MNTSIIIEGNTIDNGNYYSAGVQTYGYSTIMLIKGDSFINNNVLTSANTTGLDIQASSIITNNAFQNITSGGTSNFIKLTSCACKIMGNRFVRGASNLQSYIYITGSSGHSIVDNNFDSMTIDGTNETPVVGFANADVIDRNKNQTVYKTISLADGGSSGGFSISTTCPIVVAAEPSTGYDQTTISNTTGGTKSPFVGYKVNLADHLPIGSKLLACVFSSKLFGATITSSNDIEFELVKSLTTKVPVGSLPTTQSGQTAVAAALAGSISDIAYNINTSAAYGVDDPTLINTSDTVTGGTIASWVTTTRYLYINPGPSTDNWIISPNYDIEISVQMFLVVNASSDCIINHLLLVKYVY